MAQSQISNMSATHCFSGKASLTLIVKITAQAYLFATSGPVLHGPHSEVQALFVVLQGNFAIVRSSQIGTHVVTRTFAPQEELRIDWAGRQLVLHDGVQGFELFGPVRIVCRIGDTRRSVLAQEVNQHTRMSDTLEQPPMRGKHVHE